MQQRLPHVGTRRIDERDFGQPFFPQLLAQPRGECQPASAAADDNDALHA